MRMRMMGHEPHFLARCVTRLAGASFAFFLAWTMASCQAQPGEDQLHGMITIAFNSTAVCQAQQKLINFRNVSGEEIVIEGAAISVGTDPEGNFNLQGVRINGEDTPATTGFLNDVHVPAGANYAFIISYTPRSENTRCAVGAQAGPKAKPRVSAWLATTSMMARGSR